MGDYEKAAMRLKHLGHTAGHDDELDYLLRRRRCRLFIDALDNAAQRYALMEAEKGLVIKSARLLPRTGQAAGANTLSFRLRTHDGAGGAQTNVSDLFDGTTGTLTALQDYAFTGLATTVVAAGDWVELSVTVNGTGGTVSDVAIDIEYELD